VGIGRKVVAAYALINKAVYAWCATSFAGTVCENGSLALH